MSATEAAPSTDLGVVIALHEEVKDTDLFRGFASHFSTTQTHLGGDLIRFTFNDGNGTPRQGVLAVILGMTPKAAYQKTLQLLDRWNPAIVFNLGIAGALSNDIRLGDVLVASFADNFDAAAKAVPTEAGGYRLKFGGNPQRPTFEVFDRIRRLRDGSVYEQWRDACHREGERILGPQYQDLATSGLIRRPAQLLDGPLASGNVVGAAKDFKRELLDHNRDLVALEMEAAGVIEACNERGVRVAVLKGISDPADDSKGELERSSKDGIRAWAMSNVLDLSAKIARQLIGYDVQDGVDIRDRLLVLAEKHFKKAHRRLATDIDGTLEKYNELLRPLLGDEPPVPETQNLFETLSEAICQSQHAFPLRVNGQPGTGKTTFLTVLFLALYRRSKRDPSSPIPIYVNLKRYVESVGHDGANRVRVNMQDDFAIFARLLASRSDQSIVMLIDGIDEYVRYDDAMEHELLALVNQSAASKKVVAVGLNYLADMDRYRRDLAPFNNPEALVTLHAVSTKNRPQTNRLVDAFRVISTKGTTRADDFRDRILDRARAFQIASLDLLLLSMLTESLSSPAKAYQAGRTAEFFVHYCEQVLAKDGNETLADAAKLAFDHVVKGAANPAAAAGRRSWKLLHSHSIIVDFLIAYHVMETIRRVGRDEPADLHDLDYVYPHRVNRFCKDLANISQKIQLQVLQGSKSVYEKGGNKAKPHVCYLVGRLENVEARKEATRWLAACRQRVESRIAAREEMDTIELLLARTIYISLAYLGDKSASNEYVRVLLSRQDWNEINRGFHLEYYSDISFEPGQLLSHADPLGPFSNTYESLRERILANLKTASYGLFNIEVVTLFSLAQHRHVGENQLPADLRESLIDLIGRVNSSPNTSGTVRSYLEMLKVHLRASRFVLGDVAEKVYALKTQARVGWIRRRVPLERVESVAEHVVGAYLLGLLYLPEGNPRNWNGYSKEAVLRKVMIHDLAESIIGDYTPDEATDAKRSDERKAFQYLGMCETYVGIGHLHQAFREWHDFETSADENSRIAKDLDKLDNLVQLHLYQRQTLIPDAASWAEDLASAVTTEAGNEILGIIRQKFEGQTPDAR